MNPALFSSASCNWATPDDFFLALDAIYHFDLDVCASKENAKCDIFYSVDDDGLQQDWFGRVWCNPPYGRHIGDWIKKAVDSVGGDCFVCMLLPARTDTVWFHDLVLPYASDIQFVKGRLRFGNARSCAPFPSMIVTFGGKNE